MRHRKRIQKSQGKAGSSIGILRWRYRTPLGSPWVVYNYSANNNNGALSTFPNVVYENCWDEIHPGPPYRDGGPFNKWALETDFPFVTGNGHYTAIDRVYEWDYVGGFCWNPITVNTYMPNLGSTYSYLEPGDGLEFGVDGSHAWGDASYYGTLAWKKYRPGKNIADASVFLAELREMPRMLMTTARMWKDQYVFRFGRNPHSRTMRAAADHWLNHQFGWLPFVRDIQKFYKAWKKADATVQYIIRNNGKWVKRGGPVDLKVEEGETLLEGNEFRVANWLPTCFYPRYPSCGTYKLTRSTSTSAWLEGWFRYYVPNIETVEWRKSALKKLWGLDVNPAVIWELIPWSWLVDWFTNVGDLLDVHAGTSIVNNLVAKDTYLMREENQALKFSTTGYLLPPVTCEWFVKLNRKHRIEASPFGFNLSEEDFTLRQWSILAALGITKFKRPVRS